MSEQSPEGAKAVDDSEKGNRLLARNLLIKSKIYRFCGRAFALIGVVVFLFLYFQQVDGDVLQALHRPSTLLILIIPFLPAIVLSLMAQRQERQLMKLVKPQETAATPDEKK